MSAYIVSAVQDFMCSALETAFESDREVFTKSVELLVENITVSFLSATEVCDDGKPFFVKSSVSGKHIKIIVTFDKGYTPKASSKDVHLAVKEMLADVDGASVHVCFRVTIDETEDV